MNRLRLFTSCALRGFRGGLGLQEMALGALGTLTKCRNELLRSRSCHLYFELKPLDLSLRGSNCLLSRADSKNTFPARHRGLGSCRVRSGRSLLSNLDGRSTLVEGLLGFSSSAFCLQGCLHSRKHSTLTLRMRSLGLGTSFRYAHTIIPRLITRHRDVTC